jgi:hypothetical protein
MSTTHPHETGNDAATLAHLTDFRKAEKAAERTTLIGDRRYSLAELRAGFDLVCDRDNWKMPIDGWIAADLFVLADRGTAHFAGCHLSVDAVDTATGRLHVTAPGYYSAIGS